MQECVVIGGGPGGLAAALYLARFRLNCLLLDAGEARASLIPRCRNFPGFPEGIPGEELLERMRKQLALYHIAPIEAEVLEIEKLSEGFHVRTATESYAARTILLATGMRDIAPPFFMEGHHDAALNSGFLHYCPVCDGYEVSAKQVAVFGTGSHGAKEALFLRGYTETVALVSPSGPHTLSSSDRKRLQSANVAVLEGPVEHLRMENGRLCYSLKNEPYTPDAVYAAMGCQQRSDLATQIGAKLSEQGCIITDAHQRTSVNGVYAVGDVVSGLDQIVTAVGQAAIAATALLNDLRGG